MTSINIMRARTWRGMFHYRSISTKGPGKEGTEITAHGELLGTTRMVLWTTRMVLMEQDTHVINVSSMSGTNGD